MSLHRSLKEVQRYCFTFKNNAELCSLGSKKFTTAVAQFQTTSTRTSSCRSSTPPSSCPSERPSRKSPIPDSSERPRPSLARLSATTPSFRLDHYLLTLLALEFCNFDIKFFLCSCSNLKAKYFCTTLIDDFVAGIRSRDPNLLFSADLPRGHSTHSSGQASQRVEVPGQEDDRPVRGQPSPGGHRSHRRRARLLRDGSREFALLCHCNFFEGEVLKVKFSPTVSHH